MDTNITLILNKDCLHKKPKSYDTAVIYWALAEFSMILGSEETKNSVENHGFLRFSFVIFLASNKMFPKPST